MTVTTESYLIAGSKPLLPVQRGRAKWSRADESVTSNQLKDATGSVVGLKNRVEGCGGRGSETTQEMTMGKGIWACHESIQGNNMEQ
ncbi:hypothetical protein EYF80_058790 [Liparis tanakae]|uniref:Uncharacterized protein n=1 Tax=Liparis tanakae TaxID=230148 RepID=A0A4Z2EQE6_9TELE|nr:hypothetical protein EYF80_058790 [Liparis tanakae]